MHKPQLIIRADASTSIGAGHVMRCLAIAQAWQDAGGEATFASAALPESLKARIESEGLHTCAITTNTGSMADAAQLLSAATELKATAVVLDGYTYDVEYHRTFADSKFTSLAIDDNAHLNSYSTDFVLNQNAGVTTSAYPHRSSSTELLLGTYYALLRREFLATNTAHDNQRNGRRILVTLGGADPDNITTAVVEGLRSHAARGIEVRVIVGSINPHVDSIIERTASDERFAILQSVANMSEQYCWADVVIAAGGSSNWEMCYFGLPRIVLVIAENQIEIANELERQQIAINLGDATSITPRDVGNAVDLLFNDPERRSIARQRSLKLVDGKGAVRCVERLLNHVKSPATSLSAKQPE